MNELTPEQFNAILDRFAKLAATLPQLDEAVRRKYAEGSYERIAFDKLKAMVPRLEHIRKRLTEVRDTSKLTSEERATIQELASGLKNARAILQETDFDAQI